MDTTVDCTNTEGGKPVQSTYLKNLDNQYLRASKTLHWARLDYWTIWEAMLLVVGLCPNYFERLAGHNRETHPSIAEKEAFAAVTLLPLKYAGEFYSPSPRNEKFDLWWDLYDVLSRSDRFQDENVNPSEFVAWVKSKHFEIPQSLENQLNEVYGELPVWGYEMRHILNDADQPETVLDGPKWLHVEPTQEPRNEQKSENCEIAHPAKKDDALYPKERDSLLKLVIAMAVEQYGYDPKSARNDATANIETDLRTLGISLDRNTILKWLRAGAELLPD